MLVRLPSYIYQVSGSELTKKQETTPPTTFNKLTPASSIHPNKLFAFSRKYAAFTPSAMKLSSTRVPLLYPKRLVTHRGMAVL